MGFFVVIYITITELMNQLFIYVPTYKHPTKQLKLTFIGNEYIVNLIIVKFRRFNYYKN